MRQTIALFLNNSENHVAILLEREVKKLFFSYLSCFKYLCTRANIMAYLNHICLIFLRDKCDNRFVSHLGHLVGGQI